MPPNSQAPLQTERESESHSIVSDSLQPHELCSPWNSPGQYTGVCSCSFLQGIFPTQGSNPDLPHWRHILYQLSHQGCPRILEWVTYPFSSRSSWPRIQTGVFCIAGRFFLSWATREAQASYIAWWFSPVCKCLFRRIDYYIDNSQERLRDGKQSKERERGSQSTWRELQGPGCLSNSTQESFSEPIVIWNSQNCVF